MIKWYDAKEVHPAKNCCVVVITEHDKHFETVMGILYEDGCFNGKEFAFNNVAYWAYEKDFEKVYNALKKEVISNDAV